MQVISRARYYGKMAAMAQELYDHLEAGESCGIMHTRDRAPIIFAWAIEVMIGKGMGFANVDYEKMEAHREGGGSIEMVVPRGPRLIRVIKEE